MKRLFALALVLAACGGDDGGSTPKDDAAVGSDSSVIDAPVIADSGVDAAAATVVEVNCDGSEVGTVTTMGFAFSPMTLTISQDDVVQFVMPNTHNVVPDPTATLTDPGLVVGFNETKCLKFTGVGTFGYKCGPHSFKGSVTVQAL